MGGHWTRTFSALFLTNLRIVTNQLFARGTKAAPTVLFIELISLDCTLNALCLASSTIQSAKWKQAYVVRGTLRYVRTCKLKFTCRIELAVPRVKCVAAVEDVGKGHSRSICVRYVVCTESFVQLRMYAHQL